ncbi:hypothetical protein B0H19DRAFT_1076499 [Mycena capillaripes]|nr:hypothetical protein B0H19DRAFT_1076499 [Mycena capillaripes]
MLGNPLLLRSSGVLALWPSMCNRNGRTRRALTNEPKTYLHDQGLVAQGPRPVSERGDAKRLEAKGSRKRGKRMSCGRKQRTQESRIGTARALVDTECWRNL